MKKIGLIGGISWTSTLDYYRYINEITNEKLGGLHSAECIVYSINFDDFERNLIKYDWDAIFTIFSRATESLEKSGAELILLGANTAHIIADKLKQITSLPLIHIADATADAVISKNINKVGLLGTKYTMELDFYKNQLAQKGIESIIPESQETRDFIDYTLGYELGKGILKEETKRAYLKIIDELADKGVEGIILGCTEIPLLIKQEDVKLPVFDTTKIHSQAAVAFALSK